MVLAVPLGQMRQVVIDGIERHDLLGVDVLLDVRFRIFAIADVLALSLEHDAVQRLLRQNSEHSFLALSRLFRKFHLSVQHVATEQVTITKKLLYSEHSL